LQNETIAIAIDNESRKPVALRVHQPVGIGILDNPLPVVGGLYEPSLVERPIDGIGGAGEQPQRNLRSGAIMRSADEMTLRIDNSNGLARLRISAID